jgi:hypothetical protein
MIHGTFPFRPPSSESCSRICSAAQSCTVHTLYASIALSSPLFIEFASFPNIIIHGSKRQHGTFKEHGEYFGTCTCFVFSAFVPSIHPSTHFKQMLTTSHFLLIPCHSYQHIPCQPYPRHLARSTLLVRRMHWISKKPLLFICLNRQRKTSTFNHYEVQKKVTYQFCGINAMGQPSSWTAKIDPSHPYSPI